MNNSITQNSQNEKASLLTEFYKKNRKRWGKSKYLLSVNADIVKDGKMIPAKVVYMRNKNNRKEYLCLISADTSPGEEEIICIYGKQWNMEVFFNVQERSEAGQRVQLHILGNNDSTQPF